MRDGSLRRQAELLRINDVKTIMFRFLLRISVAVLTLIAGVSFARMVVSFRPGPFPLCEATGSTALYDSQLIRVTGALSGDTGGTFSLNDPGCGGEYGVFADVMLERQPEYSGLVEDLKRLNTADSYATSQVVLTGKFEDLGQTCTLPRYRISGARLQQAGPIKVKIVNQSTSE